MMVFEKVLKGGHAHSIIPPEGVSIGKNCVVFGKAIVRTLNKGYVEILIDRKNNLVGFISSDSPIIGYKLHKGNNITGIFAKQLDKNVYEAKLEKRIWVIKVKKIPEDIPTIKTK